MKNSNAPPGIEPVTFLNQLRHRAPPPNNAMKYCVRPEVVRPYTREMASRKDKTAGTPSRSLVLSSCDTLYITRLA